MARQLKTELKRFLPYLIEAREKKLNEADTVLRITKFFEDVLGYDTLSEISRETQLKRKYVDMAIKIDGVIRLLLEAKSASTVLRDRHIEQAESYASRNNYRWVIRREIRREMGILIDPEDLAQAIRSMLSAEAREEIGPMRIRKKRAPRKRGNKAVAAKPLAAEATP